MADALLEIESLEVRYGVVPAVRGASLSVGRGEVVGLVGPNGAGKSTLLLAIMGVVPAARGAIRYEGKSILGMRTERIVRSGIALVPEGRHIFDDLTVEENLRLGLATKPASARIPERLFDMFPVLRDMLHRRGGDLSGGQQQQLAIARALASDPKVLVLDEPTEGIQPSIIKDIERAIRTLAQEGRMAIVLVEQYYDFARSLADRYVVLSRGEVLKAGRGADMETDGVKACLTV